MVKTTRYIRKLRAKQKEYNQIFEDKLLQDTCIQDKQAFEEEFNPNSEQNRKIAIEMK